MKLVPCFRAECPACHIQRTIDAPDAETAAARLRAIGWTDVCIRCELMREVPLYVKPGVSP